MSHNMKYITVPRINIDTWYTDPETHKQLKLAMGTSQMVRLKNVNHYSGTYSDAINHYTDNNHPEIIIMEIPGDRVSVEAALERLEDILSPETHLILIVDINDVNFYQKLLGMGISQYLLSPVTSDNAVNAITQIYDENKNARRGRLISVMGATGGCGSSTIAQNIAWSMADNHNQQTLLVDADINFGSTMKAHDLNIDKDINDLLSADKIDDNLLANTIISMSDKLELLPSPASLQTYLQYDITKYEQLIDSCKNLISTTILDLPHQWNQITRHMLIESKEIIIVTSPDLIGLSNTKNIIAYLTTQRSKLPPPHYIINTLGMSKRQEISTDYFIKGIGTDPLGIIHHDPKLMSAAAGQGVPAIKLEPDSQISKIFDEIAKSLVSDEYKSQTNFTKNKKAESPLFDFLSKFKRGGQDTANIDKTEHDADAKPKSKFSGIKLPFSR